MSWTINSADVKVNVNTNYDLLVDSNLGRKDADYWVDRISGEMYEAAAAVAKRYEHLAVKGIEVMML